MKKVSNLIEKQLIKQLDDDINRASQAIHVHQSYLVQKMTDGDWHGVADAAMDIREYEAKLEAMYAVKAFLDNQSA